MTDEKNAAILFHLIFYPVWLNYSTPYGTCILDTPDFKIIMEGCVINSHDE